MVGESFEELHERNMTLEQVWMEIPLAPDALAYPQPSTKLGSRVCLPACLPAWGARLPAARPCRGPAAHHHREQSKEHTQEIKGRMVPTVINRPKERILMRAQGHPLLPLNNAENNTEEKESSKREDLVPGANDRIFLGAGD